MISRATACRCSAVLSRQPDIQDHTIDFAAGHDPVQIAAGAGGADVETVVSHETDHHPADLRIIFHDGDARYGLHEPPFAPDHGTVRCSQTSVTCDATQIDMSVKPPECARRR